MNVMPAALPLILETSIAAQMILFAGVQAVGIGRFGALRAILVIATGSMGLAAAINMLTSVGIWGGLRDVNLLLEFGCVVASYLYVARAFEGAPGAGWRDLWHLAPAGLVFTVWKTGLVVSLDGIMLAVLSTYFIATVFTVAVNHRRFRPKMLFWFAVLLTAIVAALIVLRAAMMYEIWHGAGLRDSHAYLALLLLVLCVSSAVLWMELRYPNLLSAPATQIKYATGNALSERELALLDERFRGFMESQKPFLDPQLSLNDLAAKLGIKSRELSQLANARYRMTFPALLNSWRLDEAARLLADTASANPVTTIMYDAGFGSKSSFQREFHKKFGKSPSAYRAAFDEYVGEKRSI
jgi:AraC-like DNA-binding protein